MKRKPSRVLRYMLVVVPIVYLLGIILLIFKNSFFGTAVIVGGFLATIWAGGFYYHVKNNNLEKAHTWSFY